MDGLSPIEARMVCYWEIPLLRPFSNRPTHLLRSPSPPFYRLKLPLPDFPGGSFSAFNFRSDSPIDDSRRAPWRTVCAPFITPTTGLCTIGGKMVSYSEIG